MIVRVVASSDEVALPARNEVWNGKVREALELRALSEGRSYLRSWKIRNIGLVERNSKKRSIPFIAEVSLGQTLAMEQVWWAP